MPLQRRDSQVNLLINGRSLPVKWVDKSILVAEQALINPPYTIDTVISVSAALNGSSEDTGKSALLDRVKHVVRSQFLSF
jgi:Anticodon-binding domain